MPHPNLDEASIFDLARRIADPVARTDYVEQACAESTSLKARVEELLRALDEEPEFLNEAPSGVGETVDLPSIDERPGTTIGRYKLMEQIGEGGFGVVYVAEQERPVRRKVALKVIKPGMDTKEVIARFEAERQALALMDHPNIAKVLDAGTTDSGLPYFVMELVRGIPVTEYCDKSRLDTRERLTLFLSVCHAIQHAHQKGVIHRDVKPSNVMITEHDGTPVAKVIDFGVAKAIHQRLTERTVYTRHQQIVGTPLYMSPEQAELSGLDIDTRTDIYSLGVLLYELLTGATPFDKQRFNQAAYDEIRRIIREEEPPKPSTKISTLAEESARVSGVRKADVKKLQQLMRGELDWIVMKALEKDRKRRYETANGFAYDIQRYLNNEPVLACPPSTTYRVTKFIRRHRGPVAAAAALSFVLCVGLVGTIVGLGKAMTSERKATDERDRANNLATENAELARDEIDARKEAQQNSQRLAEQLKRGTVARLAALAEGVGRRAPDRSVLLAIKAVEEAEGLDDASVAVAHETLLAATSSIGGFPISQRHSAISSDSRWLVTWGSEMQLWDLTLEDPTSNPLDLNRRSEVVLSATFSPDSRWLVAGTRAGTIHLWDLHAKAPVNSSRSSVAHDGVVTTIAFSGDGQTFFTGSEDKTVRMWNLDASGPIVEAMVFRGPKQAIYKIVVSEDGRWLAAGAGDRIRLWDQWTADPTVPLPPIEVRTGNALTERGNISPNSRWLATKHGKDGVQLLDLKSDNPIASRILLQPHDDNIHRIKFSPDSRWLVSVSWDGTGQLWDLVSKDPIGSMVKLRGHSHRVWGASFSSDSKRLLTGDSFGTVRLWDLTNNNVGQRSVVLRGHEGAAGSVAFTPDTRWAITSGWDHTVRLWDLDSADPTASPIIMRGLHGANLTVSPNGMWLVIAGYNRTRLWNISDEGRAPSPVALHTVSSLEKSNLAVSSDGHRLVTSMGDRLRVTDLRKEDPTTSSRVLRGHDDDIICIGISPDGRWLISGSRDRAALVWDLWDTEKAVPSHRLVGHEQAVSSVAISDGGRWAATGSLDETTRLWDLDEERSDQTAIVHRDHEDAVVTVAISSDERWLVTRSLNRTARLWDISSKRVAVPPVRLDDNQHHVTAVAISSDSRWIATGGRMGSVRLRDLHAKRPATSYTVLPITAYIERLAFSRDSRRLAACGWSGFTMVWDLQADDPRTEPLVFGLQGTGGTYSVSFSPDSRYLATGSQDATTRLWDLTRADPTASSLVLRGHDGRISNIEFSTSENWVVTAGARSVRLWDLDLDRALRRARRYVGRELTSDEEEQYQLK